MTFFLNDQPGPVQVKARGTDTPLTSFWGGVGAAFQQESLDANNNFRLGRETIRQRDDLAVEAARSMGAERVQPMVDAFNERARAAGMPERQMPDDLADLPSVFGPNFSEALIEEARNDPDWQGPDISDEAIEKRVNERLQKERKDAEDTLNAMGGGRFLAEIAGGLGSAIADVRNLPFLIAGGGSGSIARVMGREAMLNVAAETATLPDRFDMAKRLDIPEPDVAMTLAYAAAGGALFGGAVEGLARGITYWRGTRTGAKVDAPAYEQQMGADIAEDALADLPRPFDRIEREAVSPDARQMQRAADEPGPFGPAFRDIEDDPEAAIAKLMSVRQGEVPAAYRHPDPRVGDVALVYGNEKFGLRHIEAKHPEMLAEIPRLLREGQVVEDDQGLRRIFIADDASPANVIAMRLDWDNQDKTWVVTSFRDDWGKFARDQKEAYRTDLTDARDPASSGQPQDSDLVDILQGSRAAPEEPAAPAATEPSPSISEPGGQADSISLAMEEARVPPADPAPDIARQQAMAAGQELQDQLFELPSGSAWVDSPAERTAMMGHQTEGLRDVIAQGEDLRVDLGDGKGERPMSSVLDELDADDEFAAVIEMCGRGRMKPMESS